MIFPSYSFGASVMRLIQLDNLPLIDSYCYAAHNDKEEAARILEKIYRGFEFDATGRYMLSFAVQFVGYCMLAIGADYVLSYPKIHQTCLPDKDIPKRNYEDDDDVKKEADRVRNGMPHCKNRDYK